VSDEHEQRPTGDESWQGREAKDFLKPPDDDPPDQPIPIDPPDELTDVGVQSDE
jgi:hypothetical protein